MATHKRLRGVRVVDELPRLPTGKVLRRLLRDRERAAAGPPLSPTRRG